MSAARRAVIDVGTNSIKLLVADVLGSDVRPVHEESRQTRLGQGFYKDHRLQPGPIAKTAEAAACFAETAKKHGAEQIRIIATSAARDAVNGDELLLAIGQAAGLPVEVISGEQEASWAFQGVMTHPRFKDEPLLIMDTGGGSTELIVGCAGRTVFAGSFPLGTVRLLERLPHGDPPLAAELAQCRKWVGDFLQEKVQPRLLPAIIECGAGSAGAAPARFVGTGGTASILGCIEAGLTSFNREVLEQTVLSAERVTWHTNHLWSLTLEQRKQIVGLPPNRADVILTGCVIFEAMARTFCLPELLISTRGLRFAALLAT